MLLLALGDMDRSDLAPVRSTHECWYTRVIQYGWFELTTYASGIAALGDNFSNRVHAGQPYVS